MEIIKLNKENFEKEVVQSEKTVLVDFYADWCGPCKMLSPILEEIASELGEKVKVGKLNVDESNDLAFEYEVMSIPTLILFENGKVVDRLTGLRSKDEIRKWGRFSFPTL
nr:thioredoxin [Clostridia bacterium]